MKRLATREQSQLIDERAQQEGLLAEMLMESAANVALQDIQRYFELQEHQEIWIVCGPGHNGGDGYALARHLHAIGLHHICLLSVGDGLSKLTSLQRSLCEKQGLIVENWSKEKHGSPQLVVDALLGVGLNRDLENPYLECVQWMNSLRAKRVSLDVPSGLDCNRGIPLGMSVRADLTITFGASKPGFYLEQGPENVGFVRSHPIGLPPHLFVQEAKTHWLFERAQVQALLPVRAQTVNKSNFGKALICAGSQGSWGAALLAAQSCFKAGAGYTVLASHEDLKPLLANFPEVMTQTLADAKLWQTPWSAVGVGPGLGKGSATKALLKKLGDVGQLRAVIDADAFTVLVEEGWKPQPSWVVTPHAGELSRLLHVSAHEIESNRAHYAGLACEKLGCHVVLKGYHTVVTSPGDPLRIIHSGNSALSKAGAGDVLTGILTSFLAQSTLSIQDATSLAVFVHGYVADKWLREGNSARSLQPSDLITHLPRALYELEMGV